MTTTQGKLSQNGLKTNLTATLTGNAFNQSLAMPQ